MSKLKSGLSGNTGAMLAGAGTVVALAFGAYLSFGKPTTTPETVSVSAPQPEATIAEVSENDTPVVVDKTAPSFDELRREADGTTIIAGRAKPLSDVKILVDGAQVASAKADSSGGFAAIATLPATGVAQVVTLSSNDGEDVLASVDEIILAPAAPQTVPVAPSDEPEKPTSAVTAVAPSTIEIDQKNEMTQQAALSALSATLGQEQTSEQVALLEQQATSVQNGTVKQGVPSEKITDTEPAALTEPVENSEQTATLEQAASPAQSVAIEQPATDNKTAPDKQAALPEAGSASEAAKPEAPRVAVLKSDAEGVSLLNPVVSSSIALDTIGYSDLGEVQLTGRAQPDTAKVRVYLDNRSVISLPVSADGRWRGDLPGVDEGVYTLRVDEVSADGVVRSRVETPFKRESAAVLAQATKNTDGPIKSITVQAGATLWAIARDRYGDGTLYLRVFEANGDAIRDPDLIYPGQVFDLPN